MNKHSAIGTLIGITVGVIVYFFIPQLLNYDFFFNKSARTSTGFSEGQYFFKSGSVFVVGFLFPAIFGFLGWLIGYLYSKKDPDKVH